MFKKLKSRIAEETHRVQEAVTTQLAEGLQQIRTGSSLQEHDVWSDQGSLTGRVRPATEPPPSMDPSAFGGPPFVPPGTEVVCEQQPHLLVDVDMNSPVEASSPVKRTKNGAYVSPLAASLLFDEEPTTSAAMRSRRDSSGSVDSTTVNFLPAIPELSDHQITQTDTESVTSEQPAAGSAFLAGASKEQISGVLHKLQGRAATYKDKYRTVVRAYNEVVRENDKVKKVLTATQDSALSRVSELREERKRERRNMLETHKSAMDEKEHVIRVLKNQLQQAKESRRLASSNDAPDEALVNLSDGVGSPPPDGGDEGQRERVKRLEELLARCRDTIKANKERIATLQEENKELTSQVGHLEENQDPVVMCKALKEEFAGKLEAAKREWRAVSDKADASWAEKVREAEEERAVAIAQVKAEIHSQLEERDGQIEVLREKLREGEAQKIEEIDSLKSKLDESQQAQAALESENTELAQQLSKTKVDAVHVIKNEEEKKRQLLSEDWEGKLAGFKDEHAKEIEDLKSKHQRALEAQEAEFKRALAEQGEQMQLAIEERELSKMAAVTQQDLRADQYAAEIESLKTARMELQSTIDQLAEDNRQQKVLFEAELTRLKSEHSVTVAEWVKKYNDEVSNTQSIISGAVEQAVKEAEERSAKQHAETLAKKEHEWRKLLDDGKAMLEKNLKERKKENEKLKSENEKNTKELARSNLEIKNRDTYKDLLTTEFSNLQDAKLQLDKDFAKQKSELEKTAQDNEHLRQSLAAVKEDFESTLREHNQLDQEQIGKLQEHLEALKSEMAERVDVVQCLESERDTLQNNITNLKHSLEATEDSLRQATEKCTKLTENVATQAHEREAAEAEVSKLQQELAHWRSNNESSEKELQNLRSTLAQKEIEFDAKLSELMQSGTQEADIMRALKDEEISRLTREISDLKGDVEKLNLDLENSKTELVEKEENLKIERSNLESRTTDLEAKKDEILKLEQLLNEERTKFSNLENISQEEKSKIENLEKNLTEKERQTADLQNQLSESVKNLENASDLGQKVAEKDSQIADLTQKLSELENIQDFVRNLRSSVSQFVDIDENSQNLDDLAGGISHALEKAWTVENRASEMVKYAEKAQSEIFEERENLKILVEKLTTLKSTLESELAQANSELANRENQSKMVVEKLKLQVAETEELTAKLSSMYKDMADKDRLIDEKHKLLKGTKAELDQLQEEHSKLKIESEKMAENSGKSAEEMSHLEESALKSAQQVSDLENSIKELKSELEEMGNNLNNAQAENSGKELEILRLTEENSELIGKMEHLENSVSADSSKLGDLEHENASVKKQVEILKNEIESLTQRLETSSESLERQKSEIENFGREKWELEEKLAFAEEDSRKNAEKAVLLEDKLGNLTEGLKTLSEERNAAVEKLDQLEKSQESVENEKSERESQISEMSSKFEKSEVELSEKTQRLVELQAIVENLNGQLLQSAEERKLMEEKLASTESLIKSTQMEQKMLLDEKTEKLAEKDAEIIILTQTQSQKDANLAEMREKFELHESASAQEKEKLVGQLSDKENALRQKELELTSLSEECTKLAQQVSEAGLRLRSVEDERTLKSAQIDSRVVELESAKAELESLVLSHKEEKEVWAAEKAAMGDSEKDRLADFKKKAEAKIGQIKKQLENEKAAELARIEQQMESKIQSCDELQRGLAEANRKIEGLSTALQESQSATGDLRAQLDTVHSQRASAESIAQELEQTKEKLAQTETSLVAKEAETRKLLDKVKQLQKHAKGRKSDGVTKDAASPTPISDHPESSGAESIERVRAELESKLQQMESQHKSEVVEMQRKFEQILTEKSEEWEDERADLEKLANDARQKWERDYKEHMAVAQSDLASTDDRVKEMQTYWTQQLEESKASLQQASQKAAADLQTCEDRWKDVLKKRLDEAQSKHELELEQLQEEWRIDRKNLEIQAQRVQGDREQESAHYLKERVRQLENDVESIKAKYQKELAILVKGATDDHVTRDPLSSEPASFPPYDLRNVSLSSFPSSPLFAEPTEAEYLRNILFRYMAERETLGKEAVTLAKVIGAVLKFEPDQLQRVVQREEARALAAGWS